MISSLPPEIGLKIFETLEIEDLSKLSCLNKHFNKMINDLKTCSTPAASLFWGRYQVRPINWLLIMVRSKILSPTGFLKSIQTLQKLQKLKSQKNKAYETYKNFFKKLKKNSTEALKMKSGKQPMSLFFPPEILHIVHKNEQICTLNAYIEKYKDLTPDDLKKVLDNPQDYPLKKSNRLIVTAMKNSRLDTLKEILEHQTSELKTNQADIFYNIKNHKRSPDRKIALFNLIIETSEAKEIPLYGIEAFLKTITNEEPNFLIRGVQECNFRKCLPEFIDYLHKMDVEFERGDYEETWKTILKHGGPCNHPLFQFGQKVYLEKNIEENDLPNNYIIPIFYFHMAIEKSMSFETRKKMLEHNVKRSVSTEEMEAFENEIKTNPKGNPCNLKTLYLMQKPSSNIKKILNLSREDKGKLCPESIDLKTLVPNKSKVREREDSRDGNNSHETKRRRFN